MQADGDREESRAAVRLVVVDASVDELKPYARNPRRISKKSFARLQRTMEAHPDLLDARPVIALPDGTVVAGNMRLLAARELGLKTIPTVFAELDEVRAAQWMFLDNRSFGEDDVDVAGELLAELQGRGGDLDLTGFERRETDALLRRLAFRDKEPDELPVLAGGVPDSVFGCVYSLGRHRLMCGDATRPEHVELLLGGEAPVLIATDPPYGVELDNAWRDRAGLNADTRTREHVTTRISEDSRADWSDAFELVPSCVVIYVWRASAHACAVQLGLERVGFEVAQQIIWDKGRFVLSRQHYHWAHEPCWYARRCGVRVPWLGPANQATVWQAASPKMSGAARGAHGDEAVDHPTQKPVALFVRPIENHLQPGEVVYDPFGGSGTTLIAAEQTGRRCLMMELDPVFCDLIRARYESFTDGR
jgi:DNA methylase